ncbi:hypothetical protein KOF26_05120 [Sphingomonas sp. XMGL2]|uniref:Invasion protein IalB, involved in pathogenesis n=2 Tax=Sphingomonas quercus TaxID=2842451 RepID=A0ABS6BG26_9SPHN|nr:hypothetical protein [Sphingomonas quercus]
MLAFATVLLASPAAGRDLLGAWQGWAAFRDRDPPRCYAIARTPRAPRGFVAVAHFPGRQRAVRVHLSRPVAPGAPVRLTVDDRAIILPATGQEARGANAHADAAIIAAMRTGETLRIDATGTDGRRFRDAYALGGAASAIDAATLACPAR